MDENGEQHMTPASVITRKCPRVMEAHGKGRRIDDGTSPFQMHLYRSCGCSDASFSHDVPVRLNEDFYHGTPRDLKGNRRHTTE